MSLNDIEMLLYIFGIVESCNTTRAEAQLIKFTQYVPRKMSLNDIKMLLYIFGIVESRSATRPKHNQ